MLWIRLIWTWAMTLCLFSLTSFVIFGVWAWHSPVFPAEKCDITRKAFEKVMTSPAHPQMQELPDDIAKKLIRYWQKSDPKVPGKPDTIVVMEIKDAPFIRLIFYGGGCFLETYDIPMQSLQQLLKRAQGIEV